MSDENSAQCNFLEICSRCRTGCCQGVKPPITQKRKRIIEKYLEKQQLSTEKLFTRRGYTFPREDAKGYCAFYDKKTRKCMIHPVKPETCRAGPVTFDINRQNGKIELYLKTEKICQLAAKLLKNEEMFQGHVRMAEKEIVRLIQDLDSAALKAILDIPEPDTFKIGEVTWNRKPRKLPTE